MTITDYEIDKFIESVQNLKFYIELEYINKEQVKTLALTTKEIQSKIPCSFYHHILINEDGLVCNIHFYVLLRSSVDDICMWNRSTNGCITVDIENSLNKPSLICEKIGQMINMYVESIWEFVFRYEYETRT